MSTKETLVEKPVNFIEETPENSAFACEKCNKMYLHEDALAINMTCCGEPLKELINETTAL